MEDSTVLATVEVPFPKPATHRIAGRRQPLPHGSHLRHPRVMLPSLKKSLAKALRKAGQTAEEVAAAGIAHDASWILPVRKDGSPLADLAWGKKTPEAWTQPPRHRPPFDQARRITVIGRRLSEPFLEPILDSLSSRTYWPRVWQMVESAPSLLKKAEYFLELGDWLTWTLTGNPVYGRQALSARTGGTLHAPEGPSVRFLAQCAPPLGEIAERQRLLDAPVLPPWRPAGALTEAAARKVGLPEGIPITAPAVSTLSALVGAGIADPGQLLMNWNDPTSHAVVSRHPQPMGGIVGIGVNTVLPESWSFEAFQLGAREMFAWFAGRFHPRRGNSQSLRLSPALLKKVKRFRPGETGLVAMDWWVGNESVLHDHELTGALVGLRTDSGLEAVYRSLLEAAAFGAYTILRGFDTNGVLIRRVFVSGSTLDQCPLLGTILADVTGRDLYASPVTHPEAVGAAIYARAALENEEAAPQILLDSAKALPAPKGPAYRARAENHARYERLYDQYLILHDFLGRRSAQLMHDLGRLRSLALKK